MGNHYDDLELMPDVRTLMQNIIPIAKAREGDINPSDKDVVPFQGWYFCLVKDCSKNLSATGLRGPKDFYKHLEEDHTMTKEEIEKIKGARIIILNNETGSSNPPADVDITPLVKVLKKWTNEWKRQQTATEESPEGSNEPQLIVGYACLIKDCSFHLYSIESDPRAQVKEHINKFHSREEGKIFNIRFMFEKAKNISLKRKLEEVTQEDQGHVTETDSVETEKPDEGEELQGEKMSLKCIECACKCRIRQTSICSNHKEKKWAPDKFICSAEKANRIELIQELEARILYNEKLRYCPICMKDFNVENHLNKVHQVQVRQYFECCLCQKRIFDKDEYDRHKDLCDRELTEF